MRLIAAILALLSAVPATAQEKPSTLDPAVVHGVRMLMRSYAATFSANVSDKIIFDWGLVGLERAAERVTIAQMRAAFENNTISAERRFAHQVIVSGMLHSVTCGLDEKIVVSSRVFEVPERLEGAAVTGLSRGNAIKSWFRGTNVQP